MGIFSKLNKKADDGPDIDDVDAWLSGDESDADAHNNRSTDGLSDNVDPTAALGGVTGGAPMTASELIAAAPPVEESAAPANAVDSGNSMWHMPEASTEGSFDAPSFDAPDMNALSFAEPAMDTPSFDAPSFDAPSFDAPSFDAPAADAPAMDAVSFDAPSFDTPSFDAPSFDAPAAMPSSPSSQDSPMDVQWDVPPPPPVDAVPEPTGVTMDDLAAMVAGSDVPTAEGANTSPPPPSGDDMITPAWANASLDADTPTDEPLFEVPAFDEPVFESPAVEDATFAAPGFNAPAFDTSELAEPAFGEAADSDVVEFDGITEEAFVDTPTFDAIDVADTGETEIDVTEIDVTGTDVTGTDDVAAIPLATTLFDARPATTESTDVFESSADSSSHLAQMPQGEQATVLLEILGLESTATWPEAREARATLIAQHNPDDETDDERADLAVAIRREMNTAYAALRLLQVP